MSVVDIIKHYQRSIEKYTNDEKRILHCIGKLEKLPIKVNDLQDTGIGRTVNSLRKYEGAVGHAARTLVAKWKEMVAAESSHSEPEQDQEPDRNEQDNNINSDDDDNPRIIIDENDNDNNENDNDNDEYIPSSDNYHQEYKKHKYNENDNDIDNVYKPTNIIKDNTNHSHHKSDKSKLHHGSNNNDETDNKKKSSSTSSKKRTKADSELKDHHINNDNDEHKHKHKKKSHKSDKDKDNKEHRSDNKDKDKEYKSNSNNKDKEHKSSNHHKSSSSLSSNHYDNKTKKNHYSDNNDNNKIKSNDKEQKKKDKYNDNDDNSHKKKDKKGCEDNKKSSSSSSSKHHKSSSLSSSKHKSSTTSSKHKNDDKVKDEDRNKNKRKLIEVDILNNVDDNDSDNNDNDDGINFTSGKSFADALGGHDTIITSPSKKKFKTSSSSPKLLSSTSSASSSSSTTNHKTKNEITSTPDLLSPNIKLPSLNLDITLPTITPNYTPLPQQHVLKPANKLDSTTVDLSFVITSQKNRTKVYSGNKNTLLSGQVPTLYELCIRILQDNIDALAYTGGVPYSILLPILERCTPEQLFVLEHYNAYLLEDTDGLWEQHCKAHFKAQMNKREEFESWRDAYQRFVIERDHKLKLLTQNIKQSIHEKLQPIRQTKLAYVDSGFIKPPRSVARKQAKYGTANSTGSTNFNAKPFVTPASRVAALNSNSSTTANNRPTSSAASSSSSSSMSKPKKAPLMQKTLALIKSTNRYRR